MGKLNLMRPDVSSVLQRLEKAGEISVPSLREMHEANRETERVYDTEYGQCHERVRESVRIYYFD